MKIQLSDSFSYKKLLRFTLPSILMMIFTSVYGVVDGFFVSNYGGMAAFTAVNFIMPFLMVLGAFGFMFGTGGCALIAKTMGEGDSDKANRRFSLVIYATIISGIFFAAAGMLIVRKAALLLGATEEMADNCTLYSRIILPALPCLMLQYAFSSFFSAAEKPNLGLTVTIAAGVTNIIGDALLVGVLKMGITGAALATALSQTVGGVVPLVYFALPNSSRLRLGRPDLDMRALGKTCSNGCSELMSNISMSLVGMLYNRQLLYYAGENGVAAYGVVMYVNMIFLAIFIGYSVGTAPIISFHFGAKHPDEVRSILKKSFLLLGLGGIAMLGAAFALGRPLAKIFVGYDEQVMSLTLHGFGIFSFSFLFAGFAIFGSSFFTALGDGFTSALISFLRTLIFQSAAVMLLPLIFGVDGIWLSSVAAEITAVLVTLVFLRIRGRKRVTEK
ncbi:MAG: MATE family efflux transporter [Ruminococcus sp.]|nr:MATE family efflux transporter [Ruminococcus sp.]